MDACCNECVAQTLLPVLCFRLKVWLVHTRVFAPQIPGGTLEPPPYRNGPHIYMRIRTAPSNRLSVN